MKEVVIKCTDMTEIIYYLYKEMQLEAIYQAIQAYCNITDDEENASKNFRQLRWT